MKSLLTIAAGLAGFVAGEQSLPSRPNFLIMFADDMGYGDMSINGNPTVWTPNLDNLAMEGMRFTQWYSGFHVCSPSRASMLTGRLPIRVGCAGSGPTGGVFMADSVGGLPLNETTFADQLSAVGYYTTAIGKWHLGQRDEYLPTSRGFREYYGIPYSVDMGASPWREAGTVPGFRPLPLLHNKTIIEQPTDLEKLTDRYAEYASDFMSRMKASGDKWVLYLAWGHVHVPQYCSPARCGMSRKGRFGDSMEELDAGVGKVMAALSSNGFDDNTLVFFSSDNGAALYQGVEGGSVGPFFEGKTTTWEGGFRMPGIVRWKNVISPARISMEVVATYDIFPTILKLAGSPLPNVTLDGRDMSPLFVNTSAKTSHKCIFFWKGTPANFSSLMQDAPDQIAAGTQLSSEAKQHIKDTVPDLSSPLPGLWAVRCGAYKAHFVTYTLTEPITIQNPPVLFNVEYDVGEKYPILNTTDLYRQQMEIINSAADDHIRSIEPQVNEMARGTSPDFDICCDPNSQKKYPQYDNCTCTPSTWAIKPYPNGTIPTHNSWYAYCSNHP